MNFFEWTAEIKNTKWLATYVALVHNMNQKFQWYICIYSIMISEISIDMNIDTGASIDILDKTAFGYMCLN